MMADPVRFYNTLTRQLDTFQSEIPERVSMYVCGVTPYDSCHVGHARCYTVFDLIRRVLAQAGYQVTYVQNFTDIDDKIIARAKQENVTCEEIAERYIADYFEQMRRLNIQDAASYPRATHHIPHMIEAIQKLIQMEMAYASSGNVYFSVRKFPRYGRLSHRSLEDLVAGARVEPGEGKRDPLDFALWKAARPGDPNWESPWGLGRPGWHIECSVMSMARLGGTFDIHGGGLDLVFPHHENEIAQAEGMAGVPFARYWIHNGFVTLDKAKMSKSVGNFFTVKEVLDAFEPMALRYLLLSQHYRSPLDFSAQVLEQAQSGWNGIREAVRNAEFFASRHPAQAKESPPWPELRAKFYGALRDDFNTPEAFACLHLTAGELNKRVSSTEVDQAVSAAAGLALLKEMIEGLGFLLPKEKNEIPQEIQSLLDARAAARTGKNFAEADRLRKEIQEKGYVVEDTSSGPRLKKSK